MATAKKSAAKKSPNIAKRAPVAAPVDKIINSVDVPAVPAPKPRGRPAGSTNKRKGKKSAGRPAATRFLYSLAPVHAVDDGLGLNADEPQKVGVVGPFDSEQAAMADALASIGSRSDIEVTLYRDYRKGTVEVKTRLV